MYHLITLKKIEDEAFIIFTRRGRTYSYPVKGRVDRCYIECDPILDLKKRFNFKRIDEKFLTQYRLPIFSQEV